MEMDDSDEDVICLGDMAQMINCSKTFPRMEVAEAFVEKFKPLEDRLKKIENMKKSVIDCLSKLQKPHQNQRSHKRVERAACSSRSESITAVPVRGRTDHETQRDSSHVMTLLEEQDTEPLQDRIGDLLQDRDLQDRSSQPSRAQPEPQRKLVPDQRSHKRIETAARSSRNESIMATPVRGRTDHDTQRHSSHVISLLEEQNTEPLQDRIGDLLQDRDLQDRSPQPSRAQPEPQRKLVSATERLREKVDAAAGSARTQSVSGVAGRKVNRLNSMDNEIVLLEEENEEPVRLKGGCSALPLTLQERFNESASSSRSRLSLRPLLQEKVYVEESPSAPWKRGRIERHVTQPDQSVKYQIKIHSAGSVLVSGTKVAYWKPPRNAPIAIGSRVIACPNPAPQGEDNNYYPGVIRESPSPHNWDRFLVIFYRGDARYLPSNAIRLVCDLSEDVRFKSQCDGNHRIDVRQGDKVSTKRSGSWHKGVVLAVDCSIAKVECRDNWTKWIFLTDRFVKKRRNPKNEPIPRANICTKTSANGHTAGVNCTDTSRINGTDTSRVSCTNNANERIINSAAAKERSDTTGVSPTPAVGSNLTEDIPLPAGAPKPLRRPHSKCDPFCISWVPPVSRNTPIVIEKGGQMRQVVCWNPLAIPLLQGWRRKVVMRDQEVVVRYTTPCGKLFWTMEQIFQYVRLVESPLTMDYFDYDVKVRPLARFKVAREDRIVMRDLSKGKEAVPISVYNDYDDAVPEEFRYWHSYAQQPITDPKFLPTCSCTDGCRSSKSCSCSRISCMEMKKLYPAEDGSTYCYNFRRLLERIDSGVFECNSWCQCPSSCLNRVAQNPLSLELQVFKTLNKGWGVRCMYDIPQGSFISLYSGDLLSDTDADTEGRGNGDEYFVELDYKEVAEKSKEGYESGPEDLCPPVPKRTKTAEISSNGPTPNFVVNGKHRGNISRFFNHSCDPNVFVQNVFIDSHDAQLPRVALFAGKMIPAGTELTWDYGYTPNSVPGKELTCNCGSSYCDKRLL